MKFAVSREALLKPLQLVAGVVERRQTLPVLSNVLIVLKEDQLSLTGTDLEVEIVGRLALEAGTPSTLPRTPIWACAWRAGATARNALTAAPMRRRR